MPPFRCRRRAGAAVLLMLLVLYVVQLEPHRRSSPPPTPFRGKLDGSLGQEQQHAKHGLPHNSERDKAAVSRRAPLNPRKTDWPPAQVSSAPRIHVLRSTAPRLSDRPRAAGQQLPLWIVPAAVTNLSSWVRNVSLLELRGATGPLAVLSKSATTPDRLSYRQPSKVRRGIGNYCAHTRSWLSGPMQAEQTCAVPLPVPSGANKRSLPRGAPMQHLALRRSPERLNCPFDSSGLGSLSYFFRECGAGSVPS